MPEHLVALVQQQLGQVRAVLAGDAGDQRAARAHAGDVLLAEALDRAPQALLERHLAPRSRSARARATTSR